MVISDLSIKQKRQDEIHTFAWDMIESLPEKYRTVVLLYYMNDYSYSEIAGFLGLSVTTVKGRLQQARLKLKREFGLQEKEELKMSQVDNEFSKRVIHAVCQMATEPVKEIISFMETDHIVLYFGIDADVEVRQHEKETVEITGTKFSLAGKKEDAQRSISGIQFHKGIAEDYWEEGPHQVEVFTATGKDEDGNPVANFASSSHTWEWIQNAVAREHEHIGNTIQTALKRAVRITVGRQKGEDIILTREAYTDEVKRIFDPNWTTDRLLHGSVGHLSLVISLPPNKNITIIRGKELLLSGICNNVYLIGSHKVLLDNVEGTIYLYDSYLARAQNVKGNLLYHFYRYGGGNWSGPYAVRRYSNYETKLQKINGETHIDVGNVLIEASEVEGKTLIKNRFGNTRFHQLNKRMDGVCEINSSSGEVLLFLGEKAIGEVNVAAKTLCGKIEYSGLKDISKLNTWNTPREMYVGTVEKIEMADIQIQTESGDIRIEKVMEN